MENKKADIIFDKESLLNASENKKTYKIVLSLASAKYDYVMQKLKENELEIVDLMLTNIVDQKAEKLRDEIAPSWDFHTERVHLQAAYLIHLTKPNDSTFF